MREVSRLGGGVSYMGGTWPGTSPKERGAVSVPEHGAEGRGDNLGDWVGRRGGEMVGRGDGEVEDGGGGGQGGWRGSEGGGVFRASIQPRGDRADGAGAGEGRWFGGRWTVSMAAVEVIGCRLESGWKAYLNREMDERIDRVKCEGEEERFDAWQVSDAMMDELERQQHVDMHEVEQDELMDSAIDMPSSSISLPTSPAEYSQSHGQQQREQAWTRNEQAGCEAWDLENGVDQWVGSWALCFVRR
jgi:hypothetical protein